MKRGFTLIELLVVIAVIGILSSIVISSLTQSRIKARDAQRIATAREIQKALEMYYSDNGQYPLSGGATYPNGGWSSSNDTSWQTFMTALSPYLKNSPIDPVNTPGTWAGNSSSYVYSYYSQNYGCSQQWYMFVYRTEITQVTSPGIKTCDGSSFNYSGTVTVGQSPK